MTHSLFYVHVVARILNLEILSVFFFRRQDRNSMCMPMQVLITICAIGAECQHFCEGMLSAPNQFPLCAYKGRPYLPKYSRPL